MTQQLIPHSPALTRRQPLIQTRNPVPSTVRPAVTGGQRISEAAGRAAADCTALCCCCPCTVMNIVVLAVYKVPAGICRKVKSKRRQRRVVATKRRNGLLTQRPSDDGFGGGPAAKIDADVDESSVADLLVKEKVNVDAKEEEEEENDAVRLEKEMWDRFHGTGFWRSPSQRETYDN